MTQVSKRTPATPKQAATRRAAIDRCLDAALFKALADPTRVLLLACLMKCRRPCAVSEIAECCSVDLSVVSRHLRIMEQAGLLSAEKEGRVVRYEVRFGELKKRLLDLAAAVDECCPSAGGCCTAGACHV